MADPEHFDFSGFATADVVFVCPRGDEGSYHIEVSSAIVRNCSAVFNAMLGPHFKEGTTLAGSQSVTINLPDDDAEAMKLLFAIMHSKHNRLERDLSLAALKSLAIVVDKYDCAETTASLACLWITRRMSLDKAPKTPDLATMLHCAYLLREHEMFKVIAHTLLKTSKEPIKGESGVLVEVYAALETERIRVLMEVSDFVQNKIRTNCKFKTTSYNGCTAECSAQDIHGADFIRHLDDLHLFPVLPSSPNSVQSILDSMRVVRFGDMKAPAACRNSCLAYTQNTRAKKTDAMFRAEADFLENCIKEMCLRCVLKGSVLKPSICEHWNHPSTFGAT